MSAHTQGAPADCYVWEVPAKPVAVYLKFDVVDRILPDVLRGFAAVPKRGAEVGGILLGTVSKDGDRSIVEIVDCELVPCEYKHGPSYLLSEGDLDAFDAALAKWEAAPGGVGPVGFYRSQTREGMSPESDDLDLCANFFPDPSNVLLLIKPNATRPSTAGFFFYENGRFQEKTYLEFPFRRRELSGQAPEARRPLGQRAPERAGDPVPRRRTPLPEPIRQPEPRPPLSAEPLESSAAPIPVRELRNPVRFETAAEPFRAETYAPLVIPKARFRWVWIPLSFIFLLMGVVLGFQTALTWGNGARGSIGAESFSLGLVVRWSKESLSVRWDSASPAVKLSQRGVLEIEEGGSRKTVELDIPQLQTGSIIYRNSGDQVKFRLEVYPRDGTMVSESVSWRRE